MPTPRISASSIAKAVEAANRHEALTPASRRVLVEIIQHTNKTTGTAWPSEKRLSDALGLNVRTIGRAIAQLVGLGLITRRRRARRSSVYSVVWNAVVAISQRIKSAIANAARTRSPRLHAPSEHVHTPSAQPVETQRERQHDRTFSPDTLRSHLNVFGRGGGRQVIPDAILNAKAASRLWTAITSLGAALSQQAIAIITPDLEAEAVKAERYRPDEGRSGLAVIARHLKTTGALA